MHLEAAQIVLCSVTFTLAAAAATEFKSLWHHSPPTFHHPPPPGDRAHYTAVEMR